MTIGIIDDELSTMKRLCELIKSSTVFGDQEVDVHTFTACDDFLAFARKNPVHVAFIDLLMSKSEPDYHKKPNGFYMAEQLHAINPHISVVFVTSFIDAMQASFAYDATDFINKVDIINNVSRIDEVLRHVLRRNATLMFRIKHNRQWVILNHNDVLYFSSQQHKLWVHMKNGEAIHFTGKLDDFTSTSDFPSVLYVRCSKSYCVKISEIVRINPNTTLTMSNGDVIGISHSCYSSVVMTVLSAVPRL